MLKHMVRKEKGFSLVEVLAAVVIIGIVLLSIVPLFTQAKKMTVRNEDRLIAYHAAEAIIQQAKVHPNLLLGQQQSIKPNELVGQKKECSLTDPNRGNPNRGKVTGDDACLILINNNAFGWEVSFSEVPMKNDLGKKMVQAKVTIHDMYSFQKSTALDEMDAIIRTLDDQHLIPIHYSVEGIVKHSTF